VNWQAVNSAVKNSKFSFKTANFALNVIISLFGLSERGKGSSNSEIRLFIPGEVLRFSTDKIQKLLSNGDKSSISE
jgi:hypothetical protein